MDKNTGFRRVPRRGSLLALLWLLGLDRFADPPGRPAVVLVLPQSRGQRRAKRSRT